jgi:hypothetical protein
MPWISTQLFLHAVEIQQSCVNYALTEGAKYAGFSLAAAATVILGATKAFPGFNRSLSVSGKTALIVSLT